MYGKYLYYVTNQQMYISKIYFILPYINIYRHVSVASATIVEVPCKNTNNIQEFDIHVPCIIIQFL